MMQACGELFEYTLQHVTPEDIAAYCPGDPGYPDYVREFTAILLSRIPPLASHFDISETIGLTRWTDAEREKDPVRFRWFRTFTNAVGVAIATGPEGPDDCMPANYFAISLLDDAYALQDPRLLRLLAPAFAEFHERILETGWSPEEAPFFSLAQLVLALMGFAPSVDISRISEQVISEASKQEERASFEFLWGCTFFDQLHDRWKYFVALSFPRKTDRDSVALLRELLVPLSST